MPNDTSTGGPLIYIHRPGEQRRPAELRALARHAAVCGYGAVAMLPDNGRGDVVPFPGVVFGPGVVPGPQPSSPQQEEEQSK